MESSFEEVCTARTLYKAKRVCLVSKERKANQGCKNYRRHGHSCKKCVKCVSGLSWVWGGSGQPMGCAVAGLKAIGSWQSTAKANNVFFRWSMSMTMFVISWPSKISVVVHGRPKAVGSPLALRRESVNPNPYFIRGKFKNKVDQKRTRTALRANHSGGKNRVFCTSQRAHKFSQRKKKTTVLRIN